MKNFLIKRMVVLSQRSRKAKTVNFHPICTIITGENQTGKSSLIKSLMYTFGAKPKLLKAWEEEASKVLVYFSIDGRDFTILRDGSTYSIFSSDRTLIHQSHSITNELGPFLANLLDFGLKLTSRESELITPPPAFLFLPYYFDQDTSWAENWAGFSNLQQLSNWKKDLIEYHIGLRPNDYYVVKAKHLQVQQQINKANSDLSVLRGVKDQVMEEYQEISFNIDLESFQKEITELLVHCGTIQQKADKFKDALVELYNKKMQVESELAITRSTLSEIDKDYDFLGRKRDGDHLNCPTCNAAYTASFAEVFGLAKDSDKCEHILSALQEQQMRLAKEIDLANREFTERTLEAEKIRHLLEIKQQDVKLEDLIDSESKKKLKSVLEKKHTEATHAVTALTEKILDLKNKLDAFTDKERRKEIRDAFVGNMRRNLAELSVFSVTEQSYNDYTKVVKAQGSEQPRVILAYGFSILEMMKTTASAAYCPIVIDSPVQQEQDDKNHKQIVEFIRKRQPEGSQLIFGIVDAKGIEFPGEVVLLENKHQVLQLKEFDSAYDEMEPFIKSALEFRPSN